MRSFLIAGFVALLLGGGAAWATEGEMPCVEQPDEAGYPAAQRTALEEGLQTLRRVLNAPDTGSQRMLGQGGWDALDFAAYTAGTLERAGYATVIVRSGERVWVLVGLAWMNELMWVPVEPLRSALRRQTTLGIVAVSEGIALRFDPRYVTYAEVVELPANLPPTAAIQPVADVVVGRSIAYFAHRSVDPDGEIVLYRWVFPGSDPQVTASSSAWHTFFEVGQYTIEVTVTDSRGAQSAATLQVAVIEEPDCGCGG